MGNFTANASQAMVATDPTISTATVHGVSLVNATVQAHVFLASGQSAGVIARYQSDGSFTWGYAISLLTGLSLVSFIHEPPLTVINTSTASVSPRGTGRSASHTLSARLLWLLTPG